MYRPTTASVVSSPALSNLGPQPAPLPEAVTLTAREKEILQWGGGG